MTPNRRSTDDQSETRGAFLWRHIGPRPKDIEAMLSTVGVPSLDALMERTIPSDIVHHGSFNTEMVASEDAALSQLRAWSEKNEHHTNFIGMGYAGTKTPAVILRNVFENPGWYTQYTPYQSEISQGRLEALLNYQTMVSDLTGLPIANASMLDEPTAAAEAMTMMRRANPKNTSPRFLVGDLCHPQTIAVVKTRAAPLGIDVVVSSLRDFDFSAGAFGCLVQYPATDGRITDLTEICSRAAEADAKVCVAADLLALTLLKAPGAYGVDVCVGNAQRFGVPLGYGGPHAAFFACRDTYKRQMPGRIVGVSRDVHGNTGYRLTLQTREQHIRRERATSNICTAQVLLAIMSGMYAVYHGQEGLLHIARDVRARAYDVVTRLRTAGHAILAEPLFDTVCVEFPDAAAATDILSRLANAKINVRTPDQFYDKTKTCIGITVDETTTHADIDTLLAAFGEGERPTLGDTPPLPTAVARTTPFCTHQHFKRYRSETEMLRYLHRLQSRDLSLTTSMIPLGSCTMKLNATSEMIPVTYPGFSNLHPFVPRAQAAGYDALCESLEEMLKNITGMDAVSFQPNAGSQGEYAGLLAIRGYHHERGDTGRDICLIPSSAHGTNPASATLAGMRVIVVKSTASGDIDVADLDAKLSEHGAQVAAIMVTYPSTHGVFERAIRSVCDKVHAAGGQVYLDGANLNAQVAHCRPGDYGADVIHLNLHKTFCIPHGGGGPGMGPIAVKSHLQAYLPGDPLGDIDSTQVGPVAAARFSSASILPISWAYIAMLGPRGLRRSTEVAVLNANYMRARLQDAYEVLFTGESGFVAHEFILNAKPFEAHGVKVEDIAKRLMDYGFHAPTMSWPVPGTLMIEPTESESKDELDRFCDAMLQIRAEIDSVAAGTWASDDNPLSNAPHTAEQVTADDWPHPYSRKVAAYPLPYVLARGKFWPHVSRIDNVYGDRNVVCTCPPLDAYTEN